ncbi:VOC family protein [Hyphococcus sp. DH-69]|uniref:VOC family protein n=1 Tax=Hyphococcus formosus TaxID=3143534 RepID=UPI00398A6095
MEKVDGIGGFFYRAKDPEKLAKWYADNLGISLVPNDYDTPPWHTNAGPTVFAPFPEESEFFGPMSQQWMINFRVKDLDAMVAQLRANGNDVDVDQEQYPNGIFATIKDPEGNPIQLWEPDGKKSA